MPIVPNQSTSSWGNPSIWAGRKAQWRGGCSGSILWRAHIIHSHLDFTKEKQPASILKPTIPSPPTTSNRSPFLFVFIFILLFFLSLLICSFKRCYCQRVSWHASWLARGSSFSAACLPEEGWGWLVFCWWKRVHVVDVWWQEHKPQCFSHSVHKGLGSFCYLEVEIWWHLSGELDKELGSCQFGHSCADQQQMLFIASIFLHIRCLSQSTPALITLRNFFQSVIILKMLWPEILQSESNNIGWFALQKLNQHDWNWIDLHLTRSVSQDLKTCDHTTIFRYQEKE